jgi:DNA-binding MarR family transcriptional regulator
MPALSRTPAADALTELILETFRLNGRLLTAGDQLVTELGLTSARWQVLGAMAASPAPMPIAHIARNMGLARQSVRRLVDEMARDGLVRLAPNPHHARAKLVLPTEAGKRAFAAAHRKQVPWANAVTKGVAAGEIRAAHRMLKAIRERIERESNSPHDDRARRSGTG